MAFLGIAHNFIVCSLSSVSKHTQALSHLDSLHMSSTLILRARLAQAHFCARAARLNDGQQSVARPTLL